MDYYGNNDWRDYHLSHFGIKGMHWGIRRFQPYGKGGYEPETIKDKRLKKLEKLNGEKTFRFLKKELHKQRAKIHGGSNRWMHSKPIGPNSEKLITENNQRRKEYYSSKEYVDWMKKINNLDKKYERDSISDDAYDKEHKKLMSQRPKKNYQDIIPDYVKNAGNGREYPPGYLQNGGRAISLAYLKDLGYSASDAEKLVTKMQKANRTLGFV